LTRRMEVCACDFGIKLIKITICGVLSQNPVREDDVVVGWIDEMSVTATTSTLAVSVATLR